MLNNLNFIKTVIAGDQTKEFFAKAVNAKRVQVDVPQVHNDSQTDCDSAENYQ